jgi:hypothetical protein
MNAARYIDSDMWHSVQWPTCRAAEWARQYAVELIESGDEEAASEQALTMLTHAARLMLCIRRVFPASRPELVEQLNGIGASELAALLARVIDETLIARDAIELSAKLVRYVTSATSDEYA